MVTQYSDVARTAFADAKLTYADITAGDICVLVMMLNKHIKKAVKEHAMSTDSMHMSDKIKAKYRSNGTIISCYLYINAHYFTQRECISFNEEGFIGFCGWADDRNTAPIVNAFLEWVDALREAANGVEEG